VKQRILVTGATGFVGSHVAERLLAEGNTVRLLVRNPQRLKWFNSALFEISSASLSDERALRDALRDVDAVLHCAGVTKTARREEFFEVNEHATRSLARASEAAGVRRFVHCSTLAVCGPSKRGGIIREDDGEQPITDYGRSKLAGEIAVREECRKTEWVILRPPAVMGPRDEQFLPLFKMMWTWRFYNEVGVKRRLYSLIGVRDLVRALCLGVSQRTGLPDTYFVAMPEPAEWSVVAESFARAADKKAMRIVLPEFVARCVGVCGNLSMRLTGKPALLGSDKVREILADGWACSADKIAAAWGFRTEDALDDVVRQTLDFYRQNRWL